ncbi:hypothetical protein ACO0M4_33520 [Streptomyces sp. RGM 3693]
MPRIRARQRLGLVNEQGLANFAGDELGQRTTMVVTKRYDA